MKKRIVLATTLLFSVGLLAQTNTFPASGNVGIGTNEPASKLHIYSPAPGSISGNRTSLLTFQTPGSSNTSYLNIYSYRNSNGADWTTESTRIQQRVDNSDMGFIEFNSPGNTWGLGLGTYNTIRLMIDPYGRIGIGTSSPQSKLHINNGDNSYGAILATANEPHYGLYTKTLTSQPYSELFRLGLKYAGHENNGFISFYRGGEGDPGSGFLTFSTNGSERMRIRDNGYVGIGKVDPQALLDVYGKSWLGSGTNGSHQIVLELGQTLNGNANPNVQISTSDDGGTNRSYWTGTRWNHSFTMQRESPIGIKDIFRVSGIGEEHFVSIISSANSQEKVKLSADNNSYFINNVGIGTTTPGAYKLAVEGTIGARKVKVTQTGWADYVFHNDYRLMSLTEVEQYIKLNKHLPEVPTEKEVKENGVDVGETQVLLLKKVEELTLYLIELNKKVDEQNKQLAEQEKEMKRLKQEHNSYREKNKL